jgi:hypothetical protein
MGWLAHARLAGACSIALVPGGCGGALLPRQSEIDSSSFQSYQALSEAFRQIKPMHTTLGDLATLGFDVQNSPNTLVLSHLDLVERFLPNGSMAFDRLDPAVQACIMAEAGCQGYLFTLKHQIFDRSGSLFLDSFGFVHTTTETGWSAQVLVLVQSGQVTHKLLSGEPNVNVVRRDVQPLGPAQNLGSTVVTGGAAAAGRIK